MSQILRTFIAVEIPLEIQDRARRIIAALDTTPAHVKWVDPRHLHWTLKFLGDVDILETPAICEAVTRAVEPLAPFDVVTFGVGAFPDPTRPRTVWLGMDDGTDAMVELHDAIEYELSKLGYRAENRRFRPHLTIGRVRQSPDGLEELAERINSYAEVDAGVSMVDEVVVFSSQLGRDGPTYEPLSHIELKGH